MKTQSCSNCGKVNSYSDEELEKVFPYSREILICKYCKRTLSVCSGFISPQNAAIGECEKLESGS